jgi:hypothetical protein
MLEFLRTDFQACTLDRIQTNFLHPGKYLAIKVIALFRICLIQIFLELSIRYLVGRLKSAIIWRILLHCVIGQVYFPFKVLNIKLISAGSDVTLFKPVAFHDPMYVSDQHVMPDVELTLLVEQRTINIQLDDEGFLTTVAVSAL